MENNLTPESPAPADHAIGLVKWGSFGLMVLVLCNYLWSRSPSASHENVLGEMSLVFFMSLFFISVSVTLAAQQKRLARLEALLERRESAGNSAV
jgi:hypothetical protein